MTDRDKYLALEYENIPCWWQLGFDVEKCALIVKVHRNFVSFLPEITMDSPIVACLTKEFGFSRLITNFHQGDFGFENAFKRIGIQDDFIVYEIPIPVLEKVKMKKCPLCHGDAKGLFGGCLECGGLGERPDGTYYDWHRMYAISATFSLFTKLMSFGQNTKHLAHCLFPQLLVVDTTTRRDIHGGTLGGVYSIPLAKWLASFSRGTEIQEMTRAMMVVHKKIFGDNEIYAERETWCRIETNGWLNVNCQGDRCGLHPASSVEINPMYGYKFACHNVDTPMQQIILLAGLGALCDRARKEII